MKIRPNPRAGEVSARRNKKVENGVPFGRILQIIRLPGGRERLIHATKRPRERRA